MTQRTLLLTGASRGIGHATGKLFADEGWRVVTLSRQAGEGRRSSAGPVAAIAGRVLPWAGLAFWSRSSVPQFLEKFDDKACQDGRADQRSFSLNIFRERSRRAQGEEREDLIRAH